MFSQIIFEEDLQTLRGVECGRVEVEKIKLNNELSQLQSSWSGYTVSIFKDRTGLLGKIHQFLLRFKWYESSYEKQKEFKIFKLDPAKERYDRAYYNAGRKQMYNEVNQSIESINSLFVKYFSVKKELEKFEEDRLLLPKTSTKTELAKKKFRNSVRRWNFEKENESILKLDLHNVAKSLITSIFGGYEEFYKLPVLDLTDCEGEYFICINPKQMKENIMRFTDSAKREGFVIRTEGTEMKVQTFFQRYTNNGSNDGLVWVSCPDNSLINADGVMISKDGVNTKAYKELQFLIAGD